MVCKGYHYVINRRLVSNFYINIEPVYPGPCVRGPIVADKLRGSGFSLLPRSSSPLSTLSFVRSYL